jgi:hypothetical protein
MNSAKEIRYFKHHRKFEAYEAVASDSLQNKLYVTSARRKADTYTGQHKHRTKADRHPCLQWDSNPRSQYLSGRRHLIP